MAELQSRMLSVYTRQPTNFVLVSKILAVLFRIGQQRPIKCNSSMERTHGYFLDDVLEEEQKTEQSHEQLPSNSSTRTVTWSSQL